MMKFPTEWENKKWQPNHQPVIISKELGAAHVQTSPSLGLSDWEMIGEMWETQNHEAKLFSANGFAVLQHS